jgi:septation ring formation regulator EzrA
MIEACLTIAFACVLIHDGWRRYLTRPALELVELKAQVIQFARNYAAMEKSLEKSLDDTCAQWAVKFDASLQRTAALEKAVEKMEPGQKFNPLGKHYNPRS